MAILRGGRRIGNMDIRIGLPRDKSLVNVQGDKRLKRSPGGNPESTIGRFTAAINKGEGLARTNRYLVRFDIPNRAKVGSVTSDMTNTSMGASFELETTEMSRNVGMMCNKVELPSRDVNTETHRVYGPGRAMPYAYSFPGDISLTFYGDKFLRQRLFFENWQKKIFDIDSHNMNFYQDYIGTMDIYQLGQYADRDDRDQITYAVRLYEVYPEVISSMEYNYGEDATGAVVPVKFKYRNWRNLTIDQIGVATVGQKFGPIPTVKASKEFGLFSGILNKLPPDIRRAGRDVLQTVKRNLPIGKTTGGKVFPPFL